MTEYYKAFDKDFRCHGFQYEVGKTYVHDGEIKLCEKGLHFCEDPFDCWSYYSVTDARYALVEASGILDEYSYDSKRVAGKITIKKELSLSEFIDIGIKKIIAAGNDKQNGYETKLASNGDRAQLAISGNYVQLASSGSYSRLASSGDYSKLASSGHDSRLANSGNGSQLASSGDGSQLASSSYARLASSGNYSQLASSGNRARLISSGHDSQLASSGHDSRLASRGDYSVIAAAGQGSIAKGVIGTWLALAEFNSDGKCIGFSTGCIGQDGLEPDVYYKAKSGKLVKVED